MASSNAPTLYQMTETDMKTLIRNALLVAGNEIGESGDHWPVIKNTITDIMRDWEELEIERAVRAEIKTHLYAHLDAMDELLKTCEPAIQTDVAPRLAELREVYDAAFTAPSANVIDLTVERDWIKADHPIHYQRADAILDTLFSDETMEETHG